MLPWLQPQNPKQDAWAKKKEEKGSSKPTAAKGGTKSDGDEQWNTEKQVEPTPRTGRISHDYKQDFPSVEVESRRVLKKEGGNVRKSIDQVKLQEEVGVKFCSCFTSPMSSV